MALQDLTPQLRTRLNRMERIVGWFVFFAAALLLFGFGYYIYSKAQTNGWFLVKAKFYTYVNNATGLNVGAPVTLMGFQVGQISDITPMPPRSKRNIRIEFYVNQVGQQKDPYYGYIWSEGSLVKVNSDLLGNRSLEVTRGTSGCNVYIAHPLETLPLAQAAHLNDPAQWRLAENLYDENSNRVFHVFTALWPSNVTRIAELKRDSILAFNMEQDSSRITAIWNPKLERYQHYNYHNQDATNAYQLTVAESPSVTDQAQAMITQIQKALPGILSLTNKIADVLANAALATSNLNLTIVAAQPLLTNFADISAQLRAPGGPLIWAMGANGNGQLQSALTNVNALLAHTDTNLDTLVVSVGQTLDNLAAITGDLRTQVNENSNILWSISKAVIDTDDFVQGLKHHWLLRSAFKKENEAADKAAKKK